MSLNKVIIANNSHAKIIHDLRYNSYNHSNAFVIADENQVKIYTQWNKSDEDGICLLAVNEAGEAISTIRGNVYYSLEELETNSPIFKDRSKDFFLFPVLDLTIGATNPQYRSLGTLSVLRYYMYILHKHSVKSITGSVVKNSSMYNSCLQFGYRFRDVNTVMSDVTGTGKSVVAVNLLVELTKLGLLAQYVSKNAAPRAVYEAKLTGSMRATVIRNLFKGSGGFINTPENIFDALIVDEAHRLNEQSGLYGNQGENQIKEIINAAKSTVFFIDEDQRVTLNDIGHKEEIIKWANYAGAEIIEMELTSQFRCNGSDGYLAWLDNVLQIKETANENLLDLDYDFKVVSSPSELRDIIYEKNKINNKARLVAGYCWNWISRKDPKAFDIVFPEYDFKMRWNLQTDGSLWIISPDSVNEVGCIHTYQGLEVDYIGVIIGPDFVIRDGKAITNPSRRAKSDASTNRYKSFTIKHPLTASNFIDKIIKNTYRALMTRGMKGCYVYFTDKETEVYFKNLI